MARKHRPQRSCVVCRKKSEKRDLARFVFADEKLAVDPTGKLDGRGAYLCHNQDCWTKAAAQPSIGKALRRELSADDRDFLRQLTPS